LSGFETEGKTLAHGMKCLTRQGATCLKYFIIKYPTLGVNHMIIPKKKQLYP